MSTLDLIRSLRRTLASLREADSPVAVSRIARSLADELEADLAANSANEQDHASRTWFERENALLGANGVLDGGVEMAVWG